MQRSNHASLITMQEMVVRTPSPVSVLPASSEDLFNFDAASATTPVTAATAFDFLEIMSDTSWQSIDTTSLDTDSSFEIVSDNHTPLALQTPTFSSCGTSPSGRFHRYPLTSTATGDPAGGNTTAAGSADTCPMIVAIAMQDHSLNCVSAEELHTEENQPPNESGSRGSTKRLAYRTSPGLGGGTGADADKTERLRTFIYGGPPGTNFIRKRALLCRVTPFSAQAAAAAITVLKSSSTRINQVHLTSANGTMVPITLTTTTNSGSSSVKATFCSRNNVREISHPLALPTSSAAVAEA